MSTAIPPQDPLRGKTTLMGSPADTAPPGRGNNDEVYSSALDAVSIQTSRSSTAVPPGVLAASLAQAKHDLEEERQQHQQTKMDLRQKEQEARELRKSWLETANELNRYLRQGHGYNQMTDDDLLQHVAQLRFTITGFAAQHFSHPQLRDRKMTADLVRALLWVFLLRKVFDQFRWATLEAGAKDVVPDARRRCSMWRANTSNLVLDSMIFEGDKAYDDRQQFVTMNVKVLSKYLASLSLSPKDVIEARLQDLFTQSLELDQELNRQVASITWNRDTDEELTVRLVLAPGLSRRGRASGDRFDEIVQLLKMEVSCELAVYNEPSRRSRPATRIGRLVSDMGWGNDN
ncbi:hypothetical protein AO1008_02434 [Aspergillus oryzae 100-8]|uniref:Uncharacterized protein n=1 Tax=Aspergillus oryzae (strain 3.042) TaxID=1160506 RepID=I8U4I1_ASPO3|nr:hypothetical protein Ao3042_01864 [Aspergillus oryzae 3.042]KDE76609.1 hypothetical protein AO1008_02434 [Aspergillus oryzae 100-8]|eukprot:EIT81628.1 hypothetical protein Ao3042_01864 [Aspergillus oryzae 3.042]